MLHLAAGVFFVVTSFIGQSLWLPKSTEIHAGSKADSSTILPPSHQIASGDQFSHSAPCRAL
jgi:hypothetical protein